MKYKKYDLLFILVTIVSGNFIYADDRSIDSFPKDYPFAFPLWKEMYYPTPPPHKDKLEQAFEDLGEKFQDAAKTVGDTFQAMGEDFYNQAIKPAYTAIYEKALIPIKNETVTIANKIKEGADEAIQNIDKYGKLAIQYSKAIGKIVIKMVQNWFTPRKHHDYCPFTVPTTYEPKTIEELRNDPQSKIKDKEGWWPIVEKYAPIIWLSSGEDYFPIKISEYALAPTSSVKRKMPDAPSDIPEAISVHEKRPQDPVVIPQGQVTFEKIYELHKKNPNDTLYIDIAECTEYGSNPAFNSDKDGNLTTPMWFFAYQQNNKLYVEYLTFYGLNGPRDVLFLSGDVIDIQDFHEADLEHFTLEFNITNDPNDKYKLNRVYYGSHGKKSGQWYNANDPTIQWEGTHPIAYAARYGHGLYPKEGTYVRVYGFANEVCEKGTKWVPKNLVPLYPDVDKERFDPKTMGFLYIPDHYGMHGVSPQQSWTWNSQGAPTDIDKDAADTGNPAGGDLGRPKGYSLEASYCKNPNYPKLDADSVADFFESIEGAAESAIDWVEYQKCIVDKIPVSPHSDDTGA